MFFSAKGSLPLTMANSTTPLRTVTTCEAAGGTNRLQMSDWDPMYERPERISGAAYAYEPQCVVSLHTDDGTVIEKPKSDSLALLSPSSSTFSHLRSLPA